MTEKVNLRGKFTKFMWKKPPKYDRMVLLRIGWLPERGIL